MRLVDFDQSELLPQEKFFANGFELHQLKGRGLRTTERLTETLRNLWQNDSLPTPYSWEKKFPHVHHMRPSVYDYNSNFLDLLWDNDIPAKLYELTGRDLRLYHIQVVKQFPGPPHQDWHRDAYQYASDPIVGAFPAVIKVNFYPNFNKPEPRLKYIRGSHRCMANDARFDTMLIKKYENEILESSNEQLFIFETSILHAVCPDIHPEGSIRVMYSFAQEHEYQKRYADKDHHRCLHDRYLAYRESYATDKMAKLEDHIRQELVRGYDGDPWSSNLDAELKYDGEIRAYESILDRIKWEREKELRDNNE
jgi:hypothetical protein